MKIFENVKI